LRGSSSTTSPRAGSSSTTLPMSRVRVPRHVGRLVAWLVSPLAVDYFAYAVRQGASARSAARRRPLHLHRTPGCRGSSRGSSRRSSLTTSPHAGSSSTTSPTPRVRVPRLVAQCVVDYFASRRLVVDYFAYAARSGASARRSARRRLFRLPQARRQLLRLRRVSGCLGTWRGSSRGSSRRSSSTTSPTPRVRVPRHVEQLVTWLVVDYFDYAARPGASARRRGSSRRSSSTLPTPRVRVPRHVAWLVAPLVVDYFAYAVRPGASARRVARCRLLCLRRASGCLGTSRGSSCGPSSTAPCAVTSSCGHTGSTSATPCVVTNCLAATLALLRVHRAPLRHRLPVHRVDN
jgi:hypothetical protein